MANLYWPHYAKVRAELSYEHSDGSRRTFALTLTPENSADLTREALVNAVTGAMELVSLVREQPDASVTDGAAQQ